jgi:hypothetical protein
MLICKHCQVEGEIFSLNGEYSVGHMCKASGLWTLKGLRGVDQIRLREEWRMNLLLPHNVGRI